MKKAILMSAILAAFVASAASAQDAEQEAGDAVKTESMEAAADSAEAASDAGATVEAAADEGAEKSAEMTEEEDASGPFTGNITFVSDYRFRGITQNLSDPTLQAGLNYNHESGFYAGVWASGARFLPPATVNFEFDTLVGWAGSISDDVGLDVQLVRYNYTVDEPEADYAELIGKVTYKGLSGTIGYSNDVFNLDETGIYYALGYGLTVAEQYNVAASLGYYDLEDPAALGGSITDFSLGVSRSFGPLSVGLTYVRTNSGLEAFYGETNDSQVVFSMGSTFNF